MSKKLGGVLAMGLGILLAAGAAALPAEQVTKDAKGRVVSRTVANPDGSSRTSMQYATASERPALVVDEDLDASGRTTRRVEQRFDDGGRLREKVQVTINVAGKERGTRTRYQYDTSGRRSEDVTPLN